ncbi:MAG: hypothetical protein A3C04_01830 [Candidatus Wildermuthbacteria bacterium RIFCSPHIGHO2_02_FULL_45_25]|uniref:Uncharacterized protein n=1 Tax=Candidatus Wildermuthbacteria bacterium RIFCSPHIGHO2_02_FULL_45_25 TaxID=1802450 RepID=A0A1G2R3D4_9BACT|nr:MAG: hypothetical protein A3C04_01830 [Candidatus Wildermuthbacteria bacterium RIFCSPHIGHO2_02_FULL_45_25]
MLFPKFEREIADLQGKGTAVNSCGQGRMSHWEVGRLQGAFNEDVRALIRRAPPGNFVIPIGNCSHGEPKWMITKSQDVLNDLGEVITKTNPRDRYNTALPGESIFFLWEQQVHTDGSPCGDPAYQSIFFYRATLGWRHYRFFPQQEMLLLSDIIGAALLT